MCGASSRPRLCGVEFSLERFGLKACSEPPEKNFPLLTLRFVWLELPALNVVCCHDVSAV